jgi:hypothetical protein
MFTKDKLCMIITNLTSAAIAYRQSLEIEATQQPGTLRLPDARFFCMVAYGVDDWRGVDSDSITIATL